MPPPWISKLLQLELDELLDLGVDVGLFFRSVVPSELNALSSRTMIVTRSCFLIVLAARARGRAKKLTSRQPRLRAGSGSRRASPAEASRRTVCMSEAVSARAGVCGCTGVAAAAWRGSARARGRTGAAGRRLAGGGAAAVCAEAMPPTGCRPRRTGQIVYASVADIVLLGSNFRSP